MLAGGSGNEDENENEQGMEAEGEFLAFLSFQLLFYDKKKVKEWKLSGRTMRRKLLTGLKRYKKVEKLLKYWKIYKKSKNVAKCTQRYKKVEKGIKKG